MEAVSLSADPKFMRIIARSRARYKAEGGISAAEVRRSLGKNRTRRTPRKTENK
jgi:hypothetical protein